MLLYLCNIVDILWITLPGCDNMSRGNLSQAGLSPARKLRRVCKLRQCVAGHVLCPGKLASPLPPFLYKHALYFCLGKSESDNHV